MEPTLGDLIKLATFTSGRRIHAFSLVREAAVQMGGQDELIARIDAALEDDRHTRELDNQWDTTKGKPTYSPEVPQLDNWVDQLLTSIRDVADAYQKGALEGSPQQAAAERFVSVAFPLGVQAITSLPYVDQVAAVESMLHTVTTEASDEITTLGLDPLMDRLGALTEQYREAIAQSPEKLEFATVQAARTRGQHNLLEVVAIILGTFHRHTDPDHIAARETLLRPVLEQDKQIRAIISARRSVPDIDPDAPQAPETPATPEADSSADPPADTNA